MKKVIFALMVIFATAIFTSCTQDDDQDEIQILATDKDTCPPGGCPDE